MKKIKLTNDQIENIVRRSYQYVAMYNTNNNFAIQYDNPYLTRGWNKMCVPTGLADHTMTAIPRPNNDTLYLISMLDLRDDAVNTLTLGSDLSIEGAVGTNNLYFDLGNGAGGTDTITVAGNTSITTPGAAVIHLNQLSGAAITPGTYWVAGAQENLP